MGEETPDQVMADHHRRKLSEVLEALAHGRSKEDREFLVGAARGHEEHGHRARIVGPEAK